MTDHPITTPPELVREWCAHSNEHENYDQFWSHIATQAARWGADQELEACCEWLSVPCPSYGRELRAARRPKPPSIKEQAFALLDVVEMSNNACNSWDFSIIRRALEQLND